MRKNKPIFDAERYIQQKALEILSQNGGAKLTVETLSELAQVGLRLVPPIEP